MMRLNTAVGNQTQLEKRQESGQPSTMSRIVGSEGVLGVMSVAVPVQL